MNHIFRFKREERLKKRDEIRAVFNRGKVVTCSGAKLFVLQNRFPFNRIVFTFARKFGNAVERNRARRVGCEVYRQVRNRLQCGFDLVLLVYPGKDSFSVRMKQVGILFSKAGLLVDNTQW